MKALTYDHAPERIRTVQDLITFVKGIPPRFWCVDTRDNGEGQHCVLGHLDNAYVNKGESDRNRDGFSIDELVMANNAELLYGNSGKRIPGEGFDGKSIKSRLLKLFRSRL